jgi:hypothetical protein
MPTLMKAIAMPVSWQIGRWPSAAMRELTEDLRHRVLGAGDSSFWYASQRWSM